MCVGVGNSAFLCKFVADYDGKCQILRISLKASTCPALINALLINGLKPLPALSTNLCEISHIFSAPMRKSSK